MVYVDVYMYKTWMEETYDEHYKNPHFFVNTEVNWTKANGVLQDN